MIILLIFFLLWAFRIVINIAAYAHVWWVKEYRFDRMLIHLATEEGKRMLFVRWRRPRISPKTLAIIIGSVISVTLFWIILPLPLWGRFLVIDLLAFPLTWIIVGILQIPTLLYHEVLIAKAVHKLRSHSSMRVIGITGSYGKTSTKEFLATILGTKYSVLKTEGSKNAPIALAEVILHKLSPEHEVLVVEMGAYKKGEIARMCKMVEPSIGIVTAVNEQHQDLFGSIQTTMEAKYELIAGLTGRKIAVINADNEYTRTMSKWAQDGGKNVLLYSTREKAVFQATNIQTSDDGVSFTIVYDGKTYSAKAAVLGKHQVGNLLAAIASAVSAGMTMGEAVASLSNIVPFEKTLVKVSGISGSTFINDTFNNNPDAAIAALQVLKDMKGKKKYFVFQPMIELGKFAESAHERVGAEAAKICDGVFLTNPNFSDAFLKGVHSAAKDQGIFVLPAKEIAAELKKIVKKDDVVLFKGKESEAPLKILSTKS